MSIIDGYEADRLYEMERLVKAWRNARSLLPQGGAVAMLPKMQETDRALFDFSIREIKE
jgi:hypothetical protein